MFTTPNIDDLIHLDLEVEQLDEPWIIAVRAQAVDGSLVTLTWDGLAESAGIRWVQGDQERVVIIREGATNVSVEGDPAGITFVILSEHAGSLGRLVVRAAPHVWINDSLLAT